MKEKETRSKILMIAPLPPPIHGSAMMTRYIKDSKLINEKFKLDWVNLSTSRAMTEIGKKSPKKIFRFIYSYIKTLLKLCTHRYNICYIAITCHGDGFLKDAPFALMCKLFGYKLIIHQHNKGMAQDVNKPLYRFLFKKVYKNSKVILLSKRLYPDISDIVSSDQIVICPNGIPPIKLFSKHENNIPRLLFLSNLIESKGVFILLDACKILKEEGYAFTCDFIGGETKEIDRKRFETEVRERELDDVAHFLGRHYGEEKFKQIANCDIFVFPTYYPNECFPLVILEAMQQGKTIVTSTEGGIPDIIINEKNGFVIPVKDPRLLADKISFLLKNTDLMKTQGENNYKRYHEKFTQDVFERRILEIFRNELN